MGWRKEGEEKGEEGKKQNFGQVDVGGKTKAAKHGCCGLLLWVIARFTYSMVEGRPHSIPNSTISGVCNDGGGNNHRQVDISPLEGNMIHCTQWR